MSIDLTNDGVVRFTDVGSTPRNKPEIDDGDKTIFEHILELVDDELRTTNTESFVVDRDINFLRTVRG